MEDSTIVDLYWQRNESAIRETDRKYGHYLTGIANRILFDIEDCKESVNETYFRAWNSIPPHKPQVLAGYLAKITRQLSIDTYRKNTSKKRGGSEYVLSLSELSECIEGGQAPHRQVELQELSKSIERYLQTLPEEKRNIFVCRYFFLDSMEEIAQRSGCSAARIKSLLHRVRKGLRHHLQEEGFF